MILISDSMRATGMPDGTYTLGGLDVSVNGNRATLVDGGALAGSVTNLMDCMRTVVKVMKIPLETAVACATANRPGAWVCMTPTVLFRKGKKQISYCWMKTWN